MRAIVLEGAGAAFSAGHDLSELVGRDLPFYQRVFDTCTELMETIHKRAPAGDRQGARASRPRRAVSSSPRATSRSPPQSARFATPGVKIGLFCSTPMVPLSRAIGRKRALEMLLTGEPISAATALEWGLVNRVVPEAELDQAVDELVAAIGTLEPADGGDRQGGVLRAGRARRAPRV